MTTSPAKMPRSQWFRDFEGFSLVEILAAITIIGIVTFLAIPNIVQVKTDSEDNLARSRARALQMAVASYVQANGAATASNTWSGKSSDSERYDLVKGYIAFAEPNWTNFFPSGYTNSLPASITPPTNTPLSGPHGELSY